MTATFDVIERALREVPDLLLDADDRAILADALISVAVVEAATDDPFTVVFAGPSGSGKSFVLNLVAGTEVSAEGVLRPTTTDVVTVAAAGPSALGGPGQIPAAAGIPSGTVLVDTPSWEHDEMAARDAIGGADLVILVVSPGRYADASVAALWRELEHQDTVVVLNRAPVHGDGLGELTASIESIFGSRPIVVPEGANDPDVLRRAVVDGAAGRRDRIGRGIMERSIAAALRHLATAVTNAAWQIEAVRNALEGTPAPTDRATPSTVHDAWPETKRAMVEAVARMIRDDEDDVVRGSGAPLAGRILDHLGPWDGSRLDADLDAWRIRCAAAHVDAASIRWRRKSATQLIERLSWKSAINDEVVHSKRFLRIMGKALPEVVETCRDELSVLLAGSVEERRVRWVDVLDTLGDYRPGELTTIARELDEARNVHG